MEKKSNILIIIPAYNESENIQIVIESIHATHPEFDILVVDDGSTDRTGEFAKSTSKAFVICLPYNIGIGGSVQTGFRFAKKYNYDYAIQFDGDGQHMVHEISKLIKPLKDGEADCVVGSRFVQRKNNSYKPDFFRKTGIFILHKFSYLYIGQSITDQTSGFRSFNKRCIDLLAHNYPKDYPEPEVIVMLGVNGLKIKEVYTQMRERQGGVSSISTWRGPYYILKVLLSMTMARMRKLKLNN